MNKYLKVFCLSFLYELKNYKALVGLSIFLITCLIIFSNLWKIAAVRLGAVHLDPQQLLWYIAFNEWVLVSIPDTQDAMEEDLRSGRLAYLLPRPISFIGTHFCEAAAALAVNLLVLGITTFCFTLYQTGGLPFPIEGLGIAIILAFLAGFVAIIFQMLIGLSAFWLQDVSPFYWIWEKLLFMLGGLMLPLSIYPAWLQKIAYFTPFPAILGERSSLALHFDLDHILNLFFTLACWGMGGLFFLTLLYRRGLRILNVEGG